MKRITNLLAFTLVAALAAPTLAQPVGPYWCARVLTSPPPPAVPPPPPACVGPGGGGTGSGGPSGGGSAGSGAGGGGVSTRVSAEMAGVLGIGSPGGSGSGGDGTSGKPAPPGSCNLCTGSPCYAYSGNYSTFAVDLQLPTPGFPLAASRSYESARPIDGILGIGWTVNLSSHLYYASYLFAAPNTWQHEADIVLPSGSRFRFAENADASYLPPSTRYDTLVKNLDGSYDLTMSDGSARYHFGAAGELDTIADEFGNTLTFTHDANNRVQRISDSTGSGRYLDVYYGADGRVSSIQDNTGRTIQYTYDGRGALTSVTDPISRHVSYTYQQVRYGLMLTRIADNWGRVITDISYDSLARVHTYTEEGETYTYAYGYNGNANQTAKSDSMGNRWVYTYSADGPITDRTFPDGGTQHVVYNADRSVAQVTDEVGVITSYTYGPNARISSVTKDVGGPQTVRWDYTYDPNFPSKVTSIIPRVPSTGAYDPNWQGWKYDYYQAGTTAPGALFHVCRLQNDGVTAETIVTYVYNSRGQVMSVTDAVGATTDYGYDAEGNVSTMTAAPNNDAAMRPVWTATYDGIGRIVAIADPLNHSTGQTWDAVNRMLTQTLPKPAPSSTLDFTATIAYDVYDAVSQTVSVRETDPNGIVTSQAFDVFDRAVKNVDGLGNTTTYGYTRALLSSVTDANNNVTAYGYDGMGRVTSTTFPDNAIERLTYTSDGLLATRTDRKNQLTNFGYDHLKRLTTKSYSGAGSITWTYAGQKLTQVFDSSITPNETHTFAYDADFRITSETQATRGTISYTYDSRDAKLSYTVAGGPTASYTYYPDGSLNLIQWSPVAGSFHYAYTLPGLYSVITFPNGQTRSYTYDDQDRLLQIANVHPTAGNLATYSYSYDLNNATGTWTRIGQRVSMTADVLSQGFSGALTKYYYDNGYQLTRVDYPAAAPFNGEIDSWTYDAIGNRLAATVNGATTEYTYQRIGANPLNWQRLLTDGTNSYAFDSNGNTTVRAALALTWNRENQLGSVSGTFGMTFGYDYRGRRSGVTTNATTSYLYDGLRSIHDVASNAADYLFGPGDDAVLAIVAPNISYYVTDGLGSVTMVATAAGIPVDSYVYDAWGSNRSSSETVTQRFGYTGREPAFTDVLYNRSRFLQRGSGRFLSEDSLQLPPPESVYIYGNNNPISFIDPYGLCPWGVWERRTYGAPNEPRFHHYYFYNSVTGQSRGLGSRGTAWGVANVIFNIPVPGMWETHEKPLAPPKGPDYEPTNRRRQNVPDGACDCIAKKMANPGPPPDYCVTFPYPPDPAGCFNCQTWVRDVLQSCGAKLR